MLFGMPIKNGRRVIPSQFFNTLLCLLVLTLTGTVAYAEQAPLTLANALSRTVAQNPTLQVFDFRLQGLEGRRFTADQNPALEAGLEVENVLGSGNRQGSDAAEYTLSLSSVLELGGKREARVSVVDSRYALVEAERQAETLDVLGQVAQRFVATLALQEKLELAADAVALTEATHEIVTRRADRGAAPQAEVMRARAALTRSRIEQSRVLSEYESRKIALASLWGDTRPDFQSLEGDLFQFGSSDSFEILYQRVSESPAIQIYASERRVREAEVQLARSQSESDIRWQVGVRQFEETDD